MCGCGGGFGRGAGGSTGNINGTLTVGRIPYASGIHTLSDSPAKRTGANSIQVDGVQRWAFDGDGQLQLALGFAAHGFEIQFTSTPGTIAAPTIVTDGYRLGSMRWYGYDGASYYNGANIDAYVRGAPGVGAVPSSIEITTFDDAGDSHKGLIQNPDGTLDSTENLHALKEFEADEIATFNDVIVINNRTQNRYEALSIVANQVDIDASLSNWFDLAVGDDCEMQIPTNPIQGGVMQIRIRMGGAFDVTWDEATGGFRFANGEEPTFNTDGTYYGYFEWNDLDFFWDCVGGPRGPFGGS